jgi:hypothetical protein
LAGFAIGGGHVGLEAGEEGGFEGFAFGGEVEQALAAIGGADFLDDEVSGLEIGEDAAERLFGDGEQAEQFTDGQAGFAGDEIERAVMGAAQAFFGEQGIGAANQAGVAEVEQLDAAAQLVFAQIER